MMLSVRKSLNISPKKWRIRKICIGAKERKHIGCTRGIVT